MAWDPMEGRKREREREVGRLFRFEEEETEEESGGGREGGTKGERGGV